MQVVAHLTVQGSSQKKIIKEGVVILVQSMFVVLIHSLDHIKENLPWTLFD